MEECKNVSVKLYGQLPVKLNKIMKYYDMKRSEALRFIINQHYKQIIENEVEKIKN